MEHFQENIVAVIKQHAPVWLVGGALRDTLLDKENKDQDIVTKLKTDEVEKILIDSGYTPHRLGKQFETVSLFDNDQRIDIKHIENLEEDAATRDFTINAIYKDLNTDRIIDPLGGSLDLKNKMLKTCGKAEDRFMEDPVRILRMVKFALKYELKIQTETLAGAKKMVAKLQECSKERISAELAAILVLKEAEQGIRLLDELGYWNLFIPELSRLKGLVQNQYHSLDVWEHTLAVFKNTPPELFLRLAGLFHDLGKWETASHECLLKGQLLYENGVFKVEGYIIQGSWGSNELFRKLKEYKGQHISILGAQLDHYPHIVQLKRVIEEKNGKKGLKIIEGGKRHFLGHEQKSAEVLKTVLPRFSFSMFFDGGGSKREKDLLVIIAGHMKGTLAFMPELRGRSSKSSLKERAGELAWDLCWTGKDYDLQMVYDFLMLWEADFFAGKVHTDNEEEVFENIFKTVIESAIWQSNNYKALDTKKIIEFARAKSLKDEKLGSFKNFVFKKAMSLFQKEIDDLFLKKVFFEWQKRK